MLLISKFGHMYLEWSKPCVLFTRADLKKLHRQFNHPYIDKLMNLLKRSKVKDLDENTRKLLEEIIRQSETYNVFLRPPQRFKLILPPERIVFNEEVAIDLMWLEATSVLKLVEKQTHFNISS